VKRDALPAVIEHNPRGLLLAVSSGKTTIASSACGLPESLNWKQADNAKELEQLFERSIYYGKQIRQDREQRNVGRDIRTIMSPVTHFLSGWVLANCAQLGRRNRAIVTLACVVPDIDGLGIIPELLTRNSAHPLLWFSLYHHLLHNLAFALAIAVIAALLARDKLIGLLAFFGFHLHLIEDVIGSRGPDGYQWPIPYLAPFSHSLQLFWNGQWRLDAWQNMLITAALLAVTIWMAWRRGYSPLEMISDRTDRAFVNALRKRFPIGAIKTINSLR